MSRSDESHGGVAIPETNTRKRKSEDTTNETLSPKKSKKAKSKKKQNKNKQSDDQDADLDLDAGLNTSFAMMDSQLTADFIAQRTRKCLTKLSIVELEDKYLPKSAFRDTTSWQKPRALPSLPDYLKQFSSTDLAKAPPKSGSPHTLVVTGAGLRAADLSRSLRTFQSKDAHVAKLFAKHIKLKEAEKFVKSARINIGVGTPSRISDLADLGALSFEKLERIVIDGSHIDQKKRGIFDMEDLFVPLLNFLNREELRERYLADAPRRVEILLY